jgi:hypothetical protein
MTAVPSDHYFEGGSMALKDKLQSMVGDLSKPLERIHDKLDEILTELKKKTDDAKKDDPEKPTP